MNEHPSGSTKRELFGTAEYSALGIYLPRNN
jgi:hypothetical protein